jgi:hypothetical protein
MLRAAISGVIGFVLLFIESMIVMKLKGLETIEFGTMSQFINVWAMNFFFVFAILTQVTDWFVEKLELKEDETI